MDMIAWRRHLPVVNTAVLLAVPSMAVVCETVFGSIPNLLTLPAIVLGLTLAALGGAAPARFGAAALAFVPGVALWSLGLVGAGAVKLLIAVGALSGIRFVAVTWAATAALLGAAVLLVIAFPGLVPPDAVGLPTSPAITVAVLSQVVWQKQQHDTLPGSPAFDASPAAKSQA
jgi:hypothetical protein